VVIDGAGGGLGADYVRAAGRGLGSCDTKFGLVLQGSIPVPVPPQSRLGDHLEQPGETRGLAVV
jgi:hypothetical protein